MKTRTPNQFFLLISLIICCNTLSAMERPTKTTPPTRYPLRSKNNKFPYNTNLPKTRNLERSPLPNSPIKRKNQKKQIPQHSKLLSLKSIFFTLEEDNTIIDVFSLSTENLALVIDKTDITVDVFSMIEDLPLPTEHLTLEDPFRTDIELFLLSEF